MDESSDLRETAYYYPEPYWLAGEGGWVKSLLLFFDEIAILLPEYMRGRHVIADPTLAGPIEDLGLLRVIEPETFVDAATAAQLAEVIEALIEGGGFDDLGSVDQLAELSMSRMGLASLRAVAESVNAKLAERGLAKATEDGVSIPMHPVVRTAYLLVLAQLARETGTRHGLDLHPVTSGRRAGAGFRRLLEVDVMPSRGQIVDFDLEVVTVDLDTIPLEDVLAFKRESGGAHRRYMQNLRAFTYELSLMEQADRARALTDRRAELQDEARDLRDRARQAWRSPKALSGFGLGMTGAAWSIAAGNPVPAVLAALGAGLGMLPDKADGSAYSYLFEARKQLR